MPSPDGGDDFVWVFGPSKRFGVLISLFDEAVDGGLESDDGVENATLQSAVCQLGEKTFNSIDP